MIMDNHWVIHAIKRHTMCCFLSLQYLTKDIYVFAFITLASYTTTPSQRKIHGVHHFILPEREEMFEFPSRLLWSTLFILVYFLNYVLNVTNKIFVKKLQHYIFESYVMVCWFIWSTLDNLNFLGYFSLLFCIFLKIYPFLHTRKYV